jgi:tetratricopeptide (TPR) repeat protein
MAGRRESGGRGGTAGGAGGTGTEDIESAFLDFCLAESDLAKPEAAAAVLAAPGLDQLVAERKESAESRPHLLRLARYDVRRLAQTGANWIPEVLRWLQELDATWSESAEFCAKLCRSARDCRNSARPYLNADDIARSDLTGVPGRALMHLYLTSLRYEFRGTALEHFIESLPRPVSSLDPYTHALYAWALLVQNKPEGVAEMNAVLNRGGEDDRSVLHALQEGLQYAEEIPDHAELMLTLWRRPGPASWRDETVLLREAAALRRLGRYDEALATIDRSIMLLQPNDTDRYHRRMSERWRIREQRETAMRIAREYERATSIARREVEQTTERLLAQLDDQVSSVRQQISENLFRIVEILGIFAAVIALVVGGAAAGNSAGITWWQRAVLILTSGAVAIGFFVLLRLIVRPGPPR